ncbi:MAG: RIP metalloprotease RseP [Ruminococcaceae bacterium]|nr:RIP metalloprotease RseP [Oscillospiraceae bacterium]
MASFLSTSGTVILTLLMFGILITIHEFGHYIVARLFGVGIIEFSIGMGPKIFSWKGKKNLFSIRLLPIGGYVNMVGEYGTEDETLSEEDKNKPPFNEKPIWQRLLVVLAGPFMNILLGLVVMFCLVLNTDVIGSLKIADFELTPSTGYVTSGNNMLYITETDNKDEKGFLNGDVIVSVDGENFNGNGLSLEDTIKKFGAPKTVKVMRKNIVVDIENPVLPDASGLDLSGNLMPGDKIVEIDGRNIYVYTDMSSQIARLAIKPISVTVERDGKETVVENVIFPKYSDKNVLFGESDFRVFRKEKNAGSVLYEAFFKSISTLRMTVASITDTFSGRYGVEALSGPIGIGGQVGEMVKSEFPIQNLLTLMVLVSLSLGICNLLPLPVLDGGRVVLFLVEAIRRKPLNPKIESAIMAVSMAAVLLLMFAVALKDIVALF